MDNHKLIETIGALKEFNENKNYSIINETIELLKQELKNKDHFWNTLVNHVKEVVNDKQELARQYNCELKLASFSHESYKETEIVIRKNNYHCVVFGINNRKPELSELKEFLESKLEERLKEIDKLIQ